MGKYANIEIDYYIISQARGFVNMFYKKSKKVFCKTAY